jgi:hypothetical protein
MSVESSRQQPPLLRTRCWLVTLLWLSIVLPAWSQSPAPQLIDVHIHFDGESNVLQQLLQKLEAAHGLAILLVTPKGLPEASKFIHDHPDRFIGFGDVKLDDPNILSEIDSFHKAGFRGLGEITTTRKNYDDPVYWPIYDLASRFHMILLFHTGIVNRLHPELSTDVSFDRSRITRLDLLARKWPKLTLIGAHLGNPDYAEAAEVGRWNPNLYFDASGTTLIKKKDDYRFFRSIFWWSGIVSPHTPSAGAGAFTKLVFGSDVFGGDLNEFDGALSRYHAMLDACDVPTSDQALIFSGTMWRILQNQQREIDADARSASVKP